MSESFLIIGVMLFTMVVAIGGPVYYGLNQGKKLKIKADAVKKLYDEALDALEKDSQNSEKFQKALTLGREYYAFGNRRGDPSVQMVIEQRLQTELQARTLKTKGAS